MAEEYDAQKAYECEAPVVREEIGEGVEVKDRGIFDFVGKKDEEEKEKKETEHEHKHGHGHHHKHHLHHGEEVKEEVIAAEFEEKANICKEEKLKVDDKEVKEKKEEEKKKKKEKKEKKKKNKLGGSDSSSSTSSSSSDEEDEEKKKEKKEKKEKKKKEKKGKEEKKEEEKRIEDTAVPVEKCDEEVVLPLPLPVAEEKKGFLEKIKEKIPIVGSHAKKSEEVAAPPPPPPPPSSDFEAAAVEGHPGCNEGEAIGKEKKGFLEKIKEKIPGYHPKSHEEEKEKESAAST